LSQLEAGDGASELPSHVLCSSALRARETAELVMVGLGPDVALEVERGLYNADVDDVIERLRSVEDGTGEAPASVMVVGHNPTFAELALYLLSEDDSEGKSRLGSFPTCALAQIELPVARWSELQPGAGHLKSLFVP
jgi:phosphohistidine phosphatase